MLKIDKTIALYLITESHKEMVASNPFMVLQLNRGLDTCEYFGLVNNNELVGVVVFEKTGQIHFHLPKKGKLSLKLIKEIFKHGLTTIGTLRGKVSNNIPEMQRILKFIGAQVVAKTTQFTHFELYKDQYRFKEELE